MFHRLTLKGTVSIEHSTLTANVCSYYRIITIVCAVSVLCSMLNVPLTVKLWYMLYKDIADEVFFFAIISFLTEFFMNKLCIYFSSSIVNVPFRVKLWYMFLKDIFATKLSESRKHGSWRNFFANVVIVIFAIISLKWAFFMDNFWIYLLNVQQIILHEQTTY